MKTPLTIELDDTRHEMVFDADGMFVSIEALVALANAHSTQPGAPRELLNFVKDFATEYDRPWCTCIDAYKDRQLTDPDCHGCGMREMFYDLREKAKELIAQHTPLEVPHG